MVQCSFNLEQSAQSWAETLAAAAIRPDSDPDSWKNPNTRNGQAIWIALTPPLLNKGPLGVAAAQTFYQQVTPHRFCSGDSSPYAG